MKIGTIRSCPNGTPNLGCPVIWSTNRSYACHASVPLLGELAAARHTARMVGKRNIIPGPLLAVHLYEADSVCLGELLFRDKELAMCPAKNGRHLLNGVVRGEILMGKTAVDGKKRLSGPLENGPLCVSEGSRLGYWSPSAGEIAVTPFTPLRAIFKDGAKLSGR
jgi:hypothetical protein